MTNTPKSKLPSIGPDVTNVKEEMGKGGIVLVFSVFEIGRGGKIKGGEEG